MQLKPWKSVEDQLSLLKSRGLQVDNDQAAKDYLARIGYYRLSGYWYPLRVVDKAASTAAGKPVRQDVFHAGSRFADVVDLYVFDKKLRLLAMDALERIEMAVRVDIAYLLGQKNPCAHEVPSCLHGNFTKKTIIHGPDSGKTEHQVWLEKYKSLLERARREPFVVHHHQAYNGRLPIWVAIEVWDFGLLSKLFAGMKTADQDQIAAKYGAGDGRNFSQWLRSLNFIRNVAAHHGRLWNINVVEVSPNPTGWPRMPNSRPFMYFSLMRQLLLVICPQSMWAERFRELLTQFPKLPANAASLADLGLPEKWESWGLWSQKREPTRTQSAEAPVVLGTNFTPQ